MKKLFQILIVLFATSFLLSGCFTKEINALQSEITKLGEDLNDASESMAKETLSDEEIELIDFEFDDVMVLLGHFEENEVSAKKKYDGKTIRAKGVVSGIGENIAGEVYVTIDDGEAWFNNLYCIFKAETEIDKVALLKKGDTITVVGILKAGTLDPNLVYASIEVMPETTDATDTSGTTDTTNSSETTTASETTSKKTTETITPSGTTKATTAATTAATTTTTAASSAATKLAKDYLAYMAFSRDGLIDQLEYEGFTHEEAVYGVDNCGADWSAQALKCAKSYLNYSAFSRNGLVSQLEYEQFTSDQAIYGADNCGANWSSQAIKMAQDYLAYSSFTREGLIDQLEYEMFTYEQAVYGVDNCGESWT